MSKKRIDYDRAKRMIRELNDGRHNQREMADAIGLRKEKICEIMAGMKETEGFVYKAPPRVAPPYRPNPQVEARAAIIRDLYLKGTPVSEIAKEVGLSTDGVRYNINKWIADGIIARIELKRKPTQKKPKPYKDKLKKKVDAPVVVNQKGVNCTLAVARRCVYGNNNAERGLCNYLEITGHARILICDCHDCTVFKEREPKKK